MPDLSGRPYLKMNGIGNEIIVLDMRGAGTAVTAAEARAIGHAPGLRFDQLMVVHDAAASGAAGRLRIYNIDGSLSGACGNGARCVAFALMRGGDSNRIELESDGGDLVCERVGPLRFSVDMGEPRFDWRAIPLSCEVDNPDWIDLPDPPAGAAALGPFAAVNMGNPHAVFFPEHRDGVELARIGPLIEHHPMFPERVNVSIASVRERGRIELRVWERGAGATLACGSAACATLVAAVRRGLADRRAIVALPGGELEIAWRASDGHVIMTGDVELEREDVLPSGIFGDVRV